MSIKTIWNLLRKTVQEWSEDKAPRLAAALAYYTIFSLAPLLVLIIVITGAIIGNNEIIRSQVIAEVGGFMGQQGAEIADTLITNASQPRSGVLATILGVITLLFGATGAFGQLQDALNTIWDVDPETRSGIKEIAKTRAISFAMILVISFFLLVSLVLSAGLSVVSRYFSTLLDDTGNLIFARSVNLFISTVIITIVFALIFKILPDTTIQWRDVWIGALATAFLFNIGKEVLSWYLSVSAPASTFGAAGSLVVLLLWIYYTAQILFLGAEFTQVYSRLYGSQAAQKDQKATTEVQSLTTDADRRRDAPIISSQTSPSPFKMPPPYRFQPSSEVFRDHLPVKANAVDSTPTVIHPKAVFPIVIAGAFASLYTVGRILRKVKV